MSYFKFWRRKAGAITLLLACVFATGWIRSLSNCELFTFLLSKVKSIQVASLDSELVIGICDAADPLFSFLDQPLWTDFGFRKIENFFPAKDTDVWNWRFGSFGSWTYSTSSASIR